MRDLLRLGALFALLALILGAFVGVWVAYQLRAYRLRVELLEAKMAKLRRSMRERVE